MRKESNIKSYTAAELKANRGGSGTDLKKVDAMTDAELEREVETAAGDKELHVGILRHGSAQVLAGIGVAVFCLPVPAADSSMFQTSHARSV